MGSSATDSNRSDVQESGGNCCCCFHSVSRIQMARNCEKQHGRLNRTILAKEKEEFEKKHPKRPRLSNLHTADEIKYWLPSIKKDMDYNLKQSEVICYPDRKVTELRSNVAQLEQDYKRFVDKMKRLDPTIKHVPWTERPYESKCRNVEDEQDLSSKTTALMPETHSLINTPILERSESRKDLSPPVLDFHSNLQDLPLNFNIMPVKVTSNSLLNEDSKNRTAPSGKLSIFDANVVHETEQTLIKIFGLSSSKLEESRTDNRYPTKLNLVDYASDSDSSDK